MSRGHTAHIIRVAKRKAVGVVVLTSPCWAAVLPHREELQLLAPQQPQIHLANVGCAPRPFLSQRRVPDGAGNLGEGEGVAVEHGVVGRAAAVAADAALHCIVAIRLVVAVRVRVIVRNALLHVDEVDAAVLFVALEILDHVSQQRDIFRWRSKRRGIRLQEEGGVARDLRARPRSVGNPVRVRRLATHALTIADAVPEAYVAVHVLRVADPPPLSDMVASGGVNRASRRAPVAAPGDGRAEAFRDDPRVGRDVGGDDVRVECTPAEGECSLDVLVAGLEEGDVCLRPLLLRTRTFQIL